MDWYDFISGECSVYCSCSEECKMFFDMCEEIGIEADLQGIHGGASFRCRNKFGKKDSGILMEFMNPSNGM